MALTEKTYADKFKQVLAQASELVDKGHINRAMMILEEILAEKPMLMRTAKNNAKPKP